MEQKPQPFLLPLSYFLFQSQTHTASVCGWVPILLSAAPSGITDLERHPTQWTPHSSILSRFSQKPSIIFQDSSHPSVIYLGLPFHNQFPKFVFLFCQQISPPEEREPPTLL